MNNICIISDWKQGDYYLPIIKAEITKNIPNSVIIDTISNISNFNISQSAFIIKAIFNHLPEKTVVLNFVNNTNTQDIVIAKKDNKYIISFDNGIFDIIFENGEYDAYLIKSDKIEQYLVKTSFKELIFVDILKIIFKDYNIENIADKNPKIKHLTPIRPAFENNFIIGSIVYFDSHKNAVSNISLDFFNEIRKNRKFCITIQNKYYKIDEITQCHNETEQGELFAIFNHLNLLEIGIYMENIEDLFGLTINSSIRIDFDDE